MADLRGPPPPRWRVVERDRRLVVIDTAIGAPATSAPPSGGSGWRLRRLKFDGSAELTTHPFYDDKGPRTIRLDPGSAATIARLKLAAAGGALGAIALATLNPWLLTPAALLWNGTVRTGLRRAATAWLDRVEREAS